MSPPRSNDEAASPSGGVPSEIPPTLQALGGNLLECFHSLMKMIFCKDTDLASFFMDITVLGTQTSPVCEVLREISDLAFHTVDCQFQKIISKKLLPVAAEAAGSQACLYNLNPSFLGDFCRQLRCCTYLLCMLEFDLNFMMEKVQTLAKILRELCCPGLWILDSKDERNPAIPDLLSILEVFIDELLMHPNIRQHLATMYHVCDDAPDTIECSIGIIMECLCSHFLLSSHDGDSFNRLFRSKFWASEEEDLENGRLLSLPTAVALMGMIPLTSAPHFLQSHVILMVSRSVINSRDLTEMAKDCYFGAFEQSAILFTSLFQRSNREFDLGFDLCVRQSTRDFVISHVEKLISKSETVSSCVEYIAGNRDIIVEPWREEACLILGALLQRIEKSQPHDHDDVIMRLDEQEVCFLGALLKLMGSSLLKIVGILGERSDGWEREFVSSMMTGCFESCSLLGKRVLSPETERGSSSSRMLVHLSSLLICSVERGFYPIWEGCIFVMMAVMNFLVLDEGNLDTPKALFLRPLPLSIVPQEKASRRSSLDVAANLQKLHDLYLKKEVNCLTSEPERKEVCDGATFLRCFLKNEPLPDLDDLADFIEAKPGKDYNQMLQNRRKFNRWKKKKSIVSSRGRKLALWKKLAG